MRSENAPKAVKPAKDITMPNDQSRDRKKVTTYLAGNLFTSLKTISRYTQVPIGGLIDQAVDEYLQAIGWQDGSTIPRFNVESLKRRIAQGKE